MPRDEYPPKRRGQKPLPIEIIASETAIYRTQRLVHGPLYFIIGSANNRYDDLKGQYGVCYTSLSPAGDFAEAFLRQRIGSFVDEKTLETRALGVLSVCRPLRLVSFYGAGLSWLGISATLTAGIMAPAQAWSAVCYHHADAPDGILYRVRHDNDQFGVALFDRCEDALTTVQT